MDCLQGQTQVIQGLMLTQFGGPSLRKELIKSFIFAKLTEIDDHMNSTRKLLNKSHFFVQEMSLKITHHYLHSKSTGGLADDMKWRHKAELTYHQKHNVIELCIAMEISFIT